MARAAKVHSRQPSSPRLASRPAVSATTSGSGAAFLANVTQAPLTSSKIARACGQLGVGQAVVSVGGIARRRIVVRGMGRLRSSRP